MNRKAFFGVILFVASLDAAATITPFFSLGTDCSGASSSTFTIGSTLNVSLCVTTDVESVCGFTAQLQSANAGENGRFKIDGRTLSATYPDPNANTVPYPVSITNPAQTTDFGGTVVSGTPPPPTTQVLATFLLDPQSTATNSSYVISTSPGSSVAIENSDCFGSPVSSPIAASFTLNTPVAPSARLYGISTRIQVLTGNDVMIGGFIIGGSAAKQVVVRARGPSLGVAGALADPTLTIVPAAGGANLVNDDWQNDPNAAALQASGFAPGNAKESAILATLNPGAYTAIVSGVGNTTGIGIVEVYEIDHPEVPITGISTRGEVLTGNDVMIGGFIIQGTGPQTVAIRARGPSLVSGGIANALSNPQLTLVRASDGVTIASNDDWQSASNAAQIQASGFAPSDPKESTILMSLSPGAYTAIVSGVGGVTGVAIVEVYSTQ